MRYHQRRWICMSCPCFWILTRLCLISYSLATRPKRVSNTLTKLLIIKETSAAIWLHSRRKSIYQPSLNTWECWLISRLGPSSRRMLSTNVWKHYGSMKKMQLEVAQASNFKLTRYATSRNERTKSQRMTWSTKRATKHTPSIISTISESSTWSSKSTTWQFTIFPKQSSFWTKPTINIFQIQTFKRIQR